MSSLRGVASRAALASAAAAILVRALFAGPSYFTALWQLDAASRIGRPAIVPHRSNYALVFSYNASPNSAPLRQVEPDLTLLRSEFAFQLSFKIMVWPDVLGKSMDLWFGYTQRSFWQLYALAQSSPFRETDYEPEALLTVRSRFRVLGLDGRFVQVGLNHQSNGRAAPLSRTWDRVVINAGLERGGLSLLLKSWVHIPQSLEEAKNPRAGDYLGRGEVWAYYFLKRHRFGLMVRDNLNVRENRAAVQLEWSFPLFGRISGYLQWFLGYGESLIDYDHRGHRVGIGFALPDWD